MAFSEFEIWHSPANVQRLGCSDDDSSNISTQNKIGSRFHFYNEAHVQLYPAFETILTLVRLQLVVIGLKNILKDQS